MLRGKISGLFLLISFLCAVAGGVVILEGWQEGHAGGDGCAATHLTVVGCSPDLRMCVLLSFGFV